MNDKHRYRVKVETTVLVEARNLSQAKATAETEVRRAIDAAYINGGDFADGLEEFRYQAVGKPVRLEDE